MRISLTLSSGIVIMAMLLSLIYCGGSDTASHEHFGRIPFIFSEYAEKEAQLLKQRRQSEDFSTLVKVNNELKKLRKQTHQAFHKEYELLDFPIIIPVEGRMDYPDHTIQKVYISDILPDGRLKVTVHSLALKDSPCAFAFGRFLENDDQYARASGYIVFSPRSVHRGTVQGDTVKEGMEIVLEGFYNCARASHQTSKLALISEQEYFENK